MRRILFVDDDCAGIRMISEFLTGLGWEVIATRDGRDAAALFWTTNPDVVILDLVMPRRDGLQLLAEIRALDPAVPVIIMTGYATMERCREAMRCGATDFLSKACDPDDLTAALERAMGLRTKRSNSESPDTVESRL